MKDNVKKYLYDILVSAESIFEYLGEQRDFNDYCNNKLLRRAVEREFEIIGEAMNKLLKLNKNIKIENAKRIVNLRNFVIHGYDKVDNTIIWGIISRDLVQLKDEVEKLLKKTTT